MTDQQPNQLTGSVPLYKRPEPLTPQEHGSLGVKAAEQPFAFLREAHFVPLTVAEFQPAGLSYPIIFMGDNYQSAVVMGINAGENLFVDEQGRAATTAYMPAFVRRWPFVLAQDSAADQLVVCIDRDAEVVTDEPEARFFDDQGQLTDFSKNAVKFCEDFETERRRTESFVELMKTHDLFEQKFARFTPRDQAGQPAGEEVTIADYFGISEAKLNALSPEALVQLRDNGALSQIYAHLMSLLNWDALIALAVERSQRLGASPAAGHA